MVGTNIIMYYCVYRFEVEARNFFVISTLNLSFMSRHNMFHMYIYIYMRGYVCVNIFCSAWQNVSE